VRDFTEFTSFCCHHDLAIPRDDAEVEWVTLVGCTTGHSLALTELKPEGADPVTAYEFLTSIMDHGAVLEFLALENGAIVTYKRIKGGPTFEQPDLEPL
jgi:hypothetical protein